MSGNYKINNDHKLPISSQPLNAQQVNKLEAKVNALSQKIPQIKPEKLSKSFYPIRAATEIKIPQEDLTKLETLYAKFLLKLEKEESLDISNIRKEANLSESPNENLQLSSEVQSIAKALLSPSLKKQNVKPRCEERQYGGRIAQLALALPNGEKRSQFIAFIKEQAPELIEKYELTQAGSTTLEMSMKGIDKATPMRYLMHPENLLSTIEQTGYRPGFINSVKNHSFIVADFDGTLAAAPEAGKPTESFNIGNSPAYESIVTYLQAGGLLVINSGNDVDRICKRIEGHIPKELMGNILVGAAGGNFLVGYDSDGQRVEIDGYSRHAAQNLQDIPQNSCDMIYLGDDKSPKGNDKSGFEAAGKDRSFCVTTDKRLDEAAKSFLKQENLLTGGPEATASLINAIVERGSKTEGVNIFSKEEMPVILKAAKIHRGNIMQESMGKLSQKINVLKLVDQEAGNTSLQTTITEHFCKILKQKVPKNETGETQNFSWLQIQRHAAGHNSFREVIESAFNKLPPEQRKALQNKATRISLSAEDRAIELRNKLGLDSTSKLDHIFNVLQKKNATQDALTIAKAFNEPITIVRQGDTAPPPGKCDAWVIMGNNDMRQVDRAYDEIMKSFRSLLKENSTEALKKFPHIFISGFGGHGTSAGIIFSQTEADTIKDYLQARLNEFPEDIKNALSEKIITEPNATNSGENVRFLQEKFEANGFPKHLVISGTPSAVARQTLSFEAQSQYDFSSLQSISFDPNWYEKNYYPKDYDVDKIIHIMCRLREVASLLQYSISTNFVAPHIFEKAAFKPALEVFFDRYKDFTGKKALQPKAFLQESQSQRFAVLNKKSAPSQEEKKELQNLKSQTIDAFIDKYNAIMQNKIDHKPISKEDEKILVDTITPLSTFFRNSFAELESHYMRKMPAETRHAIQRQAMSPRSISGLLSPIRDLPPSKI